MIGVKLFYKNKNKVYYDKSKWFPINIRFPLIEGDLM